MQTGSHAPVSVAIARSEAHTRATLRRTFRDLLDRMDPPLPTLVRTGDRVLVKPFLHYGLAKPESRMVSHPEVVKLAIEAAMDCGALVSLGDAGPTRGRHRGRPDQAWIRDIARHSGAGLASFSESGARYVRSGVPYPRRYLISRAVLDADKVIGCANLQPHPVLTLSGATKNMFNAVVGKCQQQLHNLFPHPDAIARVIVDVCSLVKPSISFLDLTTIVDPQESAGLKSVGFILAGSDPVALDAVAARLVDLRPDDVPTIRLGGRAGLGCADTGKITINGLDWQAPPRGRTNGRSASEVAREGLYDAATRLINNTLLRRVPSVDPGACTRCGECRRICPVGAVAADHDGLPRIDLRKCAHCQLCIEACDADAIALQFGRVSRAVRLMLRKPLQ